MPSMVRRSNHTNDHPDLCPSLVKNPSKKLEPSLHRFHSLPVMPIGMEEIEGEGDRDDGLRFDWDPEWQGILMGCFYWSYAIFQIPAGIVISRIGPYIPVVVATFGCVLLSIVSPFAARYSISAFIACRVVLGIASAAFFPANFVLICSWVPVKERSTALSVSGFGLSIGDVLLFLCSGYLINAYTWTSLFFVPAIVSVFVFLTLVVFLRNRPEDHFLVTPEELAIITGTPVRKRKDCETDQLVEPDCNNNEENEPVLRNEAIVKEPIPWLRFMCNKAVMSWLNFKIMRSNMTFIVGTQMPTYLVNVMHMDIVNMGIMTAVHSMLGMVTSPLGACLSEWMVIKKGYSRTNTRKLFSILIGVVEATLIILIPIMRCNRTAVLILYNSSSLLGGFYAAAQGPLPAEMSTKFHGILFSIGNLCATISGFASPMIAGYVLQNIDDVWKAYDILFISAGSLVILANLIFLLFGSAERQEFDWNHEEKGAQRRVSDYHCCL